MTDPAWPQSAGESRGVRVAPPAAPRRIAGALQVLLLGSVCLPGALRAEVVVMEREQRYPLDATSFAGLNRQMADYLRPRGDDRGPRSHGLTESSIQTSYRYQSLDPAGCALRDVSISLDMTLTLPQWTPAGRPERGMRERVASMLDALASHEAGHRRNTINAAQSMERKLVGLPDAATCEQARRAAERIVLREMVRLQAREMRYDQATGNGRTQGTFMEVPAPAGSGRGSSASR